MKKLNNKYLKSFEILEKVEKLLVTKRTLYLISTK